jgi:hypothetical protein
MDGKSINFNFLPLLLFFLEIYKAVFSKVGGGRERRKLKWLLCKNIK